MSVAFGPGDFLQYDSEHKILVCKECHYAIQRSALESHLLRHKIYRGQRQRILASISKLHLLEPEEVELPLPACLPVKNLPVILGWRCASPVCSFLCASDKRMKRHWADSHGTRVNGALDETFAIKIHLQTLFRGTKLKYFEVRSFTEEAPEPSGEQQLPTNSSVTDCDLLKIKYFHHFVTSTSHTLPPVNCGGSYWPLDAVTQALRTTWLMSGILCIAAHHLAASLQSSVTNGPYHNDALILSQDITMALDEYKRDADPRRSAGSDLSLRFAAQLLCLRQLCRWSWHFAEDKPEAVGEHLTLRSFIETIRGCVDPDRALGTLLGADEAFATQAQHHRNDQIDLIEKPHDSLPPKVAEKLQGLPFRMAEVLPRPESPADFFATVSSLNSLVQCFAFSYRDDNPHTVWTAMAQWFQMIPDRFSNMLAQERPGPAALVVVGHWAALVQRAENHHWFLRGISSRLIREIREGLPQDSPVQALIKDLTV